MIRNRMTRFATLAAIATLGLAGCSDDESSDAAEGMFAVIVYGEGFIEDGIPADEFEDGWAVDFDRFLVVVGDVSLGDTPVAPTFAVYDVAQPSNGAGHTVAETFVQGGDYATLGYTIGVATDADDGNAAAADAAMMRDNGWAVFAAGSATKDGQTITFSWGFENSVRYSPCALEAAQQIDGDMGDAELTIHGDHLFFDDLGADPQLRFQLIADSDANADGEVTLEELAATDITGQDRYQVGSADITQLREFLTAQIQLLGHIDGEGHCDTE